MKVIVASKNPVKINACQQGFESYYNNVEAIGVSISSGVSDQPMSDNETLKGATTRAKNAMLSYPEANFWVGIEGGIEKRNDIYDAFAWIVILNKTKNGKARTTTFQLPKKVARLIDEGYELGIANDMIFKKENSKQKTGAVGLLTKNTISRTLLYKQAIQLALIPFINNDLYQ